MATVDSNHLRITLSDHFAAAEADRVMIVCGEHVRANERLLDALERAAGDRTISTFSGARSDIALEIVKRGSSLNGNTVPTSWSVSAVGAPVTPPKPLRRSTLKRTGR